jgi:hypothetical protein
MTPLKRKTCRGCGIEKPLSEFRRRPDVSHGTRAQCKVCMSTRDHEYRLRAEARRAHT